jgi:hypothetical protein
MRTEEDEAFDELARKQGMWGGGFKAKQAMAADKLHWSDCAVHNGPAYPAGECDCGVMNDRQRLEAIVSVINKYLPPDGIHINEAMSEIISLVDPLPAQEQRPWVSLTDAEIDKTYWRREPFRRPTQFEFARDIEQLLKEKNT